MNRFTAALFAATMLCLPVGAMAQTPSPAIMAAVNDAARPAADKAADVNRKPAQVLAFAGVKPGMVIAELGSGGGYYTRMLAKTVGPNGTVFAVATQAQASRAGGLDGLNALAAAYPNVKVVTVPDLASISLPQKVDMVWTTENYHDFHNGPTANVPGLDKSVFDSLKPGGTFYVEDHSAAPSAGLAAASKLHRMDEAIAKSELAAAGFTLEAEGDALHSTTDDRSTTNSEEGHFVTDRFMLRLKRP